LFKIIVLTIVGWPVELFWLLFDGWNDFLDISY